MRIRRLRITALLLGVWLVAGQDVLWAVKQLLMVGAGPASLAAQATVWGTITGTLADQTDLQTALNGKQASGSYATGTGTANGTNTGDQTITLTGNVTGSGTGSFAATIANDAVTYAKMQNVSATDRILGRSTAGAGDVEEIVMTAAGRALVDDADASAQRTTLGLGTLATQSGTFSGTSSGTNTGDQTTVSGNAGTATALQTIRTINGVNFDGTANITVTAAGSTLSDNVPTSKLNSGTSASSSTFWRGDGTWASTPTSYRTKVTLGGDVTDSAGAATYVDCTGLSFAVTSGTRYNFYALIWYTSAATATGSKWAINGPATTNMAYKSTYTLTATTVTTNFATAYDIPTAANATSLTAGNITILEGTILPSANGTVIVRFATELDTSAVVCKAGSTLEWWTP